MFAEAKYKDQMAILGLLFCLTFVLISIVAAPFYVTTKKWTRVAILSILTIRFI
jgi:hypothetical protein